MTHLFHPGSILKTEFLDEYDLSVSTAAKALGITRARLNDIVIGARSITVDTALLLGKYFRTTPEFWLNLQTRYDLSVGLSKAKNKLKNVKPIKERIAA